jgi:hypothetical protein
MEARSIAFRWISSLRNSSSQQYKTHTQSKQALIGASLVLRATYDVEIRQNHSIFNSHQDVSWYLYAGNLISGHIIESLPIGIRLLAYRDRRISYRLHSYIHDFCVRERNLLHQVISLKWSDSIAGSNWEPLETPANRWWFSTIYQGFDEGQQVIHINIIDGSILIEGRSFDRLPADYTNHSTYKSLFGAEVISFPMGFHKLTPQLLQEVDDVRCSIMKGMSYQGRYHDYEV